MRPALLARVAQAWQRRPETTVAKGTEIVTIRFDLFGLMSSSGRSGSSTCIEPRGYPPVVEQASASEPSSRPGEMPTAATGHRASTTLGATCPCSTAGALPLQRSRKSRAAFLAVASSRLPWPP